MNFLETVLTNSTVEALKQHGITGTYTFNVTVDETAARLTGLIDGMTFTGHVPLPLPSKVDLDREDFTITVTV
ncbi:hypothetical protein FY046_01775 [Erwinia sp. 1181_3]|uniref:hypothetical protein n=1 Tax=Erwinia sp. 1181_3 TaxID=2605957 RepID=UPI00405A2232